MWSRRVARRSTYKLTLQRCAGEGGFVRILCSVLYLSAVGNLCRSVGRGYPLRRLVAYTHRARSPTRWRSREPCGLLLRDTPPARTPSPSFPPRSPTAEHQKRSAERAELARHPRVKLHVRAHAPTTRLRSKCTDVRAVLAGEFQSEREEETRDRAERGSVVRGSDQASVEPKRIARTSTRAMQLGRVAAVSYSLGRGAVMAFGFNNRSS